MDDPSCVQVLDAIMAGASASEATEHLGVLPALARQEVLCFLCGIHDELSHTCSDRGQQVFDILTAGCPLFVDGRATCLLP